MSDRLPEHSHRSMFVSRNRQTERQGRYKKPKDNRWAPSWQRMVVPQGDRNTPQNKGQESRSNGDVAPPGVKYDLDTMLGHLSVGHRETTQRLKLPHRLNLSVEAVQGKHAQDTNPTAHKRTDRGNAWLPDHPIQMKYTYDGKEYGDPDNRKTDVEGVSGDGGAITSANSDKGMPTFYKIIKSEFKNQINEKFFKRTKDILKNNCDRPHEVSARIKGMGNEWKDAREQNQAVTAIGNLGTEELRIRDGDWSSVETEYHGGHLIGYQILGGEKADQQWNVAPQDANNNQFAYNNTIEAMLRTAAKNTEINYEVEIKYASLNFRVNQQQLLDHGAISSLDKTKPWIIQLPSRIPKYWEARAAIVSNNETDSFAKPTQKDDNREIKSYEQYSPGMESELSHNDAKQTARYNIKYIDALSNEVSHEKVGSKIKDVKKVVFKMHQVQPTDSGVNASVPNDWGDKVEADFGSVTPEKITADQVINLIKSIQEETKNLKIDNEKLEFMDIDEIHFKYVKEVTKPTGVEEDGSLFSDPSLQAKNELAKKNVRSLHMFVDIFNGREEAQKINDAKQDFEKNSASLDKSLASLNNMQDNNFFDANIASDIGQEELQSIYQHARSVQKAVGEVQYFSNNRKRNREEVIAFSDKYNRSLDESEKEIKKRKFTVKIRAGKVQKGHEKDLKGDINPFSGDCPQSSDLRNLKSFLPGVNSRKIYPIDDLQKLFFSNFNK